MKDKIKTKLYQMIRIGLKAKTDQKHKTFKLIVTQLSLSISMA